MQAFLFTHVTQAAAGLQPERRWPEQAHNISYLFTTFFLTLILDQGRDDTADNADNNSAPKRGPKTS